MSKINVGHIGTAQWHQEEDFSFFLGPAFPKYHCAVPISHTLILDIWLVLSDKSANVSF